MGSPSTEHSSNSTKTVIPRWKFLTQPPFSPSTHLSLILFLRPLAITSKLFDSNSKNPYLQNPKQNKKWRPFNEFLQFQLNFCGGDYVTYKRVTASDVCRVLLFWSLESLKKLFFRRFSLGVLNELDAMADFATLAINAATLTVANIWPKTQTNHLL